MTTHWSGFSGSINTDINDVTEDAEQVDCILCQQWMKLNPEKAVFPK